MGNCSCIDRSAVVSWADDDWDEGEWTAAGTGSPAPSLKKQQQQLKERLLNGSPGKAQDSHRHAGSEPLSTAATDTDPAAIHEVKIKISKRQLQELVGKSGGGDGVEELRQAIEGLLGSGGWDWEQVAREAAAKADAAAAHDHHWRPNLQSIPEGAE